MNNILWNHNGNVLITFLAEGVDSDSEAALLLERGIIPATAIKVAVNQALPIDFESYCWKWLNGNIVRDSTAEKGIIWNRIKAERDRRIQSSGYKVGTKWFHSDTFSRTQQMGLVMMGASIPANTPWKTMDGSTVVMTQTLAGQIFATAAGSDIAIFAAAETHKAAMEASADPASYDFSTGWPKGFGE